MTNSAANSDVTTAGVARLAFIAGVVGAAISVIGGFFDSAQFFRSYIVAYIFWLAIPLGSLAFLMLHFLVGGRWGVMIRRLLESATRTLPLIALLFVLVYLFPVYWMIATSLKTSAAIFATPPQVVRAYLGAAHA